MKYQFHFDIRVVQNPDVAVATVEAEGFENLIGVSKRHPKDQHDPAVGQVIALGRLFAHLAEHYQEVTRIIQEANRLPDDLEDETQEDEDFWAMFEVPAEELG